MDDISKVADGTCVPMSQIAVAPTKCGECGSYDLRWVAEIYKRGQFELGCNACLNTVKAVSAEDIAKFLNDLRGRRKVVSADDVAEAMTALRELSRAPQHPPTDVNTIAVVSDSRRPLKAVGVAYVSGHRVYDRQCTQCGQYCAMENPCEHSQEPFSCLVCGNSFNNSADTE
jgi:hypothetical protein